MFYFIKEDLEDDRKLNSVDVGLDKKFVVREKKLWNRDLLPENGSVEELT